MSNWNSILIALVPNLSFIPCLFHPIFDVHLQRINTEHKGESEGLDHPRRGSLVGRSNIINFTFGFPFVAFPPHPYHYLVHLLYAAHSVYKPIILLANFTC